MEDRIRLDIIHYIGYIDEYIASVASSLRVATRDRRCVEMMLAYSVFALS